jgi:nitrate/nitrite transport system permease protein
MTFTTNTADIDTASAERREQRLAQIRRLCGALQLIGLGCFAPLLRLIGGANPREELRQLWRQLGVPLVAIAAFLLAWDAVAPRVQTSLGALPGPAQVWERAVSLYDSHVAERAKEAAFNERQKQRNAEILAADPTAQVKIRPYVGRPTFFDQILTSLKTVFTGFVLAALVAVPLGVLCGLSPTINAAFNPLVQIFKPVSPLAWLPIVTMVVSALYVTEDPLLSKSFLNSAITVTLCSLWPTLINTAYGVASIDKDLLNVARVLKLNWPTKVRKLVLP